jgi:2-keto-4-pentenoate hydratase
VEPSGRPRQLCDRWYPAISAIAGSVRLSRGGLSELRGDGRSFGRWEVGAIDLSMIGQDELVAGSMAAEDADELAAELLAASDGAHLVEPISERRPNFDIAAAYEVLERISTRRRDRGWVPVGRKIGFTNRTIWSLYGVDAPMWAPVWDRTVHASENGRQTLSLRGLVQPRIEPEVVFRLKGPLPITDDPAETLSAVESIAAGFEIVQCHYPDWRFTLPDCTAAFGLHGALVIGPWVPVDNVDREALVARLMSFEAILRCHDQEVDRGTGENVLGSPAHALTALGRVLTSQTQAELAAGEVVTTGTITNAWPVAPGQTWTSDYGSLGVQGLHLTFS